MVSSRLLKDMWQAPQTITSFPKYRTLNILKVLPHLPRNSKRYSNVRVYFIIICNSTLTLDGFVAGRLLNQKNSLVICAVNAFIARPQLAKLSHYHHYARLSSYYKELQYSTEPSWEYRTSSCTVRTCLVVIVVA